MGPRWAFVLGVSALSGLLPACQRKPAPPSDPVEATLTSAGVSVKSLKQDADGTYLVDLSESDLADLTPLKGLPISALDLHKTAVTDLSPLRGLPLRSLVLCRSKVSDLGPLEGMHLRALKSSHTAINDLSPLRGMTSLRTLWVHESPVTDLAPLGGLHLTELRFSPEAVESGLAVILEMESLVWINQVPAATFKRRHADWALPPGTRPTRPAP